MGNGVAEGSMNMHVKQRIKEGQTVQMAKRKRMEVESQKAIMSKQINWFVFILADGYEPNVPPSYAHCS